MASRVPYILARTLKDAHDFARDRGFERGRYRVVNSPATLKSVRNADLFLLPGWERRYDRFAMKGAIRWTRMNVIDAAELKELAPVVDFPDIPRAPVTVTPEEAHDFLAVQAANVVTPGADWDAPGDPLEDLKAAKELAERQVSTLPPLIVAEIDPAVPDDLNPPGEQLVIGLTGELRLDETEPEAKPGRRRRRCKDCGVLHYKGDPCTPSESV